DVATVTSSRSRMPNDMFAGSLVDQPWLNRKLALSACSAGIAWMSRKSPIKPIRATTKIPAPVVRFWKMLSPGRTFFGFSLTGGSGAAVEVGCSEIGSSGGVVADDERPPGSPVGVRV